MKSKKSNIVKLASVVILGFILIFASKQLAINNSDVNVESIDGKENVQIETGDKCISKISTDDTSLRTYYFDVGQADSILVVNKGKTLLIDAGNNDDGDLVVNNLKKLGITRLDYVIGTHPHEDHIGGLDTVIDQFEIGTIYMPKVKANTKTFEDVLDSIAKKNLTVTTPKVGDKFTVGDANCEVMNIGNSSDDLNACSIVIRMEQDDVSYLFMGDAEEVNESARQWPQTTILKVGHHGSTSSSSQKFLDQIKPSVAIISVGEDNKYGHPHKETIEKLEKMNTKIYMTKDLGNIEIIQK